MKIYSVSSALQEQIRHVGEVVQDALQESVSLVEYVTLPEAGQHIVLRFEVQRPVPTLEDLDRLEGTLCNLVGEEFWAVLVGRIFSQVEPPLPLSELPARLERLAQALYDMPVPTSSTKHALLIQHDAQIIRNRLSLAQNEWVWEVEVPVNNGGPSLIRIVSEKLGPEQALTVDGQQFQVEYVPQSGGYLALVKAYPDARRVGSSLMHYVFNRTEGQECN